MSDTKENIKRLASDQFFKFGYAHVRIDDIVKELRISKRTFYEHFANKEDLLNNIVNDCMIDTKLKIDEIVRRMDEGNVENFLSEIINLWSVSSDNTSKFSKEFLAEVKRYSPQTYEEFERFREKEMKRHFFKIAKIGQDRGTFRSEINLNLLYLIKSFIFQRILYPDVIMELPMTTEEVITSIYDILFMGLLTEKGRQDYQTAINISKQ